MKKIFSVLILSLLNVSNNNAQTYRQLFDKLDMNFQNAYTSFYSNIFEKI